MRQWIKLHTEILRDPKMNSLPDHRFRVCINLFALAGQLDEGGRLGTADDMAFHLRTSAEDATAELKELSKIGVTCNKKGVWWLKNWEKRNGKPLSEQRQAVRERVKKHRENKANPDEMKRDGNDYVTALHLDGNDPRIDKSREEEKRTTGAGAPGESSPKTEPPDPLKELAAVFEQASGVKLESIPPKSQGALFWDPLSRMIKVADGIAPDILRQAIAQMRRTGMTIGTPGSTLKVFNSIHGASVTGAGKSSFVEVE